MIVPPLVTEVNNLAENAPRYADDVTTFVNENKRLRELNADYDITSRLEEEAGKLPAKLGGAAATLRDVGLGIVNSIFALVTILILTAFMLGSGRRWIAGGPALPARGARGAHRPGDRPLVVGRRQRTWRARSPRPRSPGFSPTSCS